MGSGMVGIGFGGGEVGMCKTLQIIPTPHELEGNEDNFITCAKKQEVQKKACEIHQICLWFFNIAY